MYDNVAFSNNWPKAKLSWHPEQTFLNVPSDALNINLKF